MAAEELFKRYLEIGASMLGMTRERADAIVSDLVASGEVAKGQAAKAAEWLVERGRAGTEELTETIRREIRQQVTAMGLATREDVARLEARLDSFAPADATGPGLAATPRAGASRTATKAASRKADPAAAKARRAPAGGPEGAGITRSGTVGRKAARPGAGAGPPPGDADPPKG